MSKTQEDLELLLVSSSKVNLGHWSHVQAVVSCLCRLDEVGKLSSG